MLSDKNPSEEMIREGVLKKYSREKNSSREKWSDRYFILDAKCIYYGKDKKSIAKAFTRIDLETVSIQDAQEYGKYSFQLTIAQHNKYILKGNNSQNKEKWMQSISNQCSIVRENREFEIINQNIRKEEKKRSLNDENLISECHDFEKLVAIGEGVKLLISLEPREDVQKCLQSIFEYKNFRNRPSQALQRAECNCYLVILNAIEDIKCDENPHVRLHEVFDQEAIDAKQKKLSDIKKKLKYNTSKVGTDVDLYKELFEEFIVNFVNAKRKQKNTDPDYRERILDKLHELPLIRWKSNLRSIPESILSQSP